jgi:hypothetical protein
MGHKLSVVMETADETRLARHRLAFGRAELGRLFAGRLEAEEEGVAGEAPRATALQWVGFILA